jgi:hypothetical protein
LVFLSAKWRCTSPWALNSFQPLISVVFHIFFGKTYVFTWFKSCVHFLLNGKMKLKPTETNFPYKPTTFWQQIRSWSIALNAKYYFRKQWWQPKTSCTFLAKKYINFNNLSNSWQDIDPDTNCDSKNLEKNDFFSNL